MSAYARQLQAAQRALDNASPPDEDDGDDDTPEFSDALDELRYLRRVHLIGKRYRFRDATINEFCYFIARRRAMRPVSLPRIAA